MVLSKFLSLIKAFSEAVIYAFTSKWASSFLTAFFYTFSGVLLAYEEAQLATAIIIFIAGTLWHSASIIDWKVQD